MKYVQVKKMHGGLVLHTINHYQILFKSSTTNKLKIFSQSPWMKLKIKTNLALIKLNVTTVIANLYYDKP